MLNINDLEARHAKYKVKSYIPYATIAISIIAILIFIITIFNYNSNAMIDKKNVIKESNIFIKSVQQKEEVLENVPPTPKDDSINKTLMAEPAAATMQSSKEQLLIIDTEEKEKIMLSPSLNFMRKMQAETVPDYKNEKIKNQTEPVAKKSPKKKLVNEKIEEIKISTVEIKTEDNSISIKKQNTYSDIDHVVKRFKINNNPALSLFVAKKYYQLGEYEKAYNYALITNGINNNIEASWIIFAKALIKLDKRDMATETLKKYINQSSSSQAKILLDEILSGKFKWEYY